MLHEIINFHQPLIPTIRTDLNSRISSPPPESNIRNVAARRLHHPHLPSPIPRGRVPGAETSLHDRLVGKIHSENSQSRTGWLLMSRGERKGQRKGQTRTENNAMRHANQKQGYSL
ncbi:hypothetical protein ElyMa_003307900 [Elysia marginata]|uniref:Uncharacterized protein n=1 Tax=Elysia marginata TaxID=1093978 RepID=A0AAV4JGT2_9GAST|nr:hypothetical protein ElyMa_003307900 [Elysia marginata]